MSLGVNVRLDVLQRGASILYADASGLWVMVLFAPPKHEDILLARDSLRAMKRRYPEGFPTLTWVRSTAGLSMDADSRKSSAVITSEFAEQIAAQATLIEGNGFQAATVRAIISGIDMLARSKSPKKVFSELKDAIAWAFSHSPRAETLRPPVEAVLAALESLRDTYL